MKFREKTTLDQRGPIEQYPPEAVQGLLVAEKPIGRWEEGHTQFGNDEISIFPAYHNGEKGFLILYVWESSSGYSCTGLSEERLVSFKEGVNMLLEHGAYEHLFNNGQGER